jgi:hypothetical protein
MAATGWYASIAASNVAKVTRPIPAPVFLFQYRGAVGYLGLSGVGVWQIDALLQVEDISLQGGLNAQQEG